MTRDKRDGGGSANSRRAWREHPAYIIQEADAGHGSGLLQPQRREETRSRVVGDQGSGLVAKIVSP
jgi:hypothetical protein